MRDDPGSKISQQRITKGRARPISSPSDTEDYILAGRATPCESYRGALRAARPMGPDAGQRRRIENGRGRHKDDDDQDGRLTEQGKEMTDGDEDTEDTEDGIEGGKRDTMMTAGFP